jgi:ABC-type lipoprotein release transport system permease subunit
MNNGLQYKLKEGINQAISGQLTVYNSANGKVNILESQLKEQRSFPYSSGLLDTMNVDHLKLAVNRRIRFGSLVSYDEETSYVNVHALEADHIQRIGRLLSLQSGSLPVTEASILISETTADELKCTVGDTLLLLANNINDYMSDEIAVVSGVFKESGIAIFLNYNAFVPYPFGEELTQIEPGNCVELIVNSANGQELQTKEIQTMQSQLAGLSPDMHVATWEQTVPLLYKIVQVWKGGGYLTQLIFVVFSLLILVNLATLIIHSRKREIGTLFVFGFSWLKVTGMLMVEYLIIAVVGVSLGVGSVLLFTGSMNAPGLFIASPDLQAALMTDYMLPFLYIKDVVYVLCLFGVTTLLAVWLSMSRIKGVSPIRLLSRR